MNKKVVISKCDDCPYFDYYYYSYNEECRLLGRKMSKDENGYYIPTHDCPLEDVNEEVL